MNNPILKVKGKEEENVLFLDEKVRKEGMKVDQGWYKQIFVEVKQEVYKVYLIKDCQASDLLLAFEEKFNLKSTHLYYRGFELNRDEWLGHMSNGTSFLVLEDGDGKRNKIKTKKFEGGKVEKEKEEIGYDENNFQFREVTDLSLDLQISDDDIDEVDLPDSTSNLNFSFDDSLFDGSLLAGHSGSNQPTGSNQNITLPEPQSAISDTNAINAQIEAMVKELIHFNPLPPPTENQPPESELIMGFPREIYAEMGMELDLPLSPEKEKEAVITHHSENSSEDIKMTSSSAIIEISDNSSEDLKIKNKNPKKTIKRKNKWKMSTPKKTAANCEERKNAIISTPSPIKLEERDEGKRKPNWSLDEKIKLLTTVILKMKNPFEGYNKDGKRFLFNYVYRVISPSSNPERLSRPFTDIIQQYYRTGNPSDQSNNGRGMHHFLMMQCHRIGQEFTKETLRRNLERFVEEYRRQFLSQKGKGNKEKNPNN